MPNLTRDPFDGGRELVCRRDMAANGRHFKRGAAFDWRRSSISERRVRQMYEAGWIGYPHGEVIQPALLAEEMMISESVEETEEIIEEAKGESE